MNDSERKELTEGWPADPQNEELARFAEEFQAGLPTLPAESLAKVERRLQEEVGRRARRRRLAGLAMAAGILLAVGGYVWLRPAPLERAGAPVEDRFTVELAAPQPPLPPQPPLVRLDEHQSLFAD
jgi:hypothetical protein